MSNTPQTLEVVSTSARAVAPDLPGRVERIRTYHAGTLRSFRDQMGYAFLAGVEFMALKDTTKHGDFEKLCTEFLGDIPKRTRCRYMDFAEALITKSATVALLAKEPRLLTNSEIAKEDAEKICKAVHDAADGKTLTELYRDLGVIRQPKAKVHTPPKPESPDDAIASEKEQHESVLNDIVIAINLALENLDSPDSPLRNPAVLKTRQAAVDACARFQREVANLKTRRTTLAP